MTLNISDDELQNLVTRMIPLLAGQFAPGTLVPTVNGLQGWQKKVAADGSFGRIFNGPQWLDNVAIRDGTITGAKLTADLVISNTFRTNDPDVSPTGDRMELDKDGLRFYGTVSGVANTKTVDLQADGDFTLGTGSNQIAYVAATGTLTVPKASIGALTIADIGSGTLTGTYQTAASGARVALKPGGVEGFNSAGTSTFLLSAADGSGRLGVSGSGLSWNSSGQVSVDGSLIVSNTITAAKLNITSLSAITANLGTVTAGSINAASVTVSNINASNVNSGSLNGALLSAGSVADSAVAALSANKITAGTGIINNLTVKSTLTLGSGGKIIDADGSYWDQNGIVLKGGGAIGDVISWQSGASIIGYATNDASYFYVGRNSGFAIRMGTTDFQISPQGTGWSALGPSFIMTSSQISLRDSTGTNLFSATSTATNVAGNLTINGSGGAALIFKSVGNGGSAASWPADHILGQTSGGSNISFGYFEGKIGTQNIRIPFLVP